MPVLTEVPGIARADRLVNTQNTWPFSVTAHLALPVLTDTLKHLAVFCHNTLGIASTNR